MSARIIAGDCLEQLGELDADSVDAIVTDPPYGLEFMGKDWDRFAVPRRRQVGQERTGDPVRAEQPRYIEMPLAERRAFGEWCFQWATAALRVLKPGGHLLAFGGTRTYHRLACAVEDAGFELRDSVIWLYGEGFPKSLNVAAAIDKAARGHPQGSTRGDPDSPNAGRYKTQATEGKRSETDRGQHYGAGPGQFMREAGVRDHERDLVDEAEPWEGWGTALKPAHEPIVVARKPFRGNVAANVLEHGTGAINVGGCKVGTQGGVTRHTSSAGENRDRWEGNEATGEVTDNGGRWPANVVLSHLPDCQLVGERSVNSDGHYPAGRPQGSSWAGHGGQDDLEEARTAGEVVETWECVPGCPIAALNAQSGESRSTGGSGAASGLIGGPVYGEFSGENKGRSAGGFGDTGGASRFFYCAKATRLERDAGLEAFDKRPLNWSSGEQNPGSFQSEGTDKSARNAHPTVKPMNLMRWLVRLVTPPGGTVLDPFTGSGTTGCAAVLEGFDFIGIEREPDYIPIAEARVTWWAQHRGREAEEILGHVRRSSAERERMATMGQGGLFE